MKTMDSHVSKADPAKEAALLREAEEWLAKQKAATSKVDPVSEFEKARAALAATLAKAPESVTIPFEITPAGERAAQFKRVCDERFYVEVDYLRVKCRAAFDRVLAWDGRFPGPAATGSTGLGKTLASWCALRRLYVDTNMPFAWFPVRRLVTELERYEKKDCADEFFRNYDFFKILFVDDLDKINWDFESHAQMLFSFFDWVYRTKKPCIVTTNRSRKWWTDKAGEAFVRRLFVDACVEVEFK